MFLSMFDKLLKMKAIGNEISTACRFYHNKMLRILFKTFG